MSKQQVEPKVGKQYVISEVYHSRFVPLKGRRVKVLAIGNAPRPFGWHDLIVSTLQEDTQHSLLAKLWGPPKGGKPMRPLLTKTCGFCPEKFTTRRPEQRFCSRLCASKAANLARRVEAQRANAS